jgi:hypothetical protein
MRPQPPAPVVSCEICGTGLCPEAQADGVPCESAHGICETCAYGAQGRRQWLDGREDVDPSGV